MFKERLLKNWVTSLIGLAMTVIALASVLLGRATWGEVLPVLTFAMPFFAMTDPNDKQGALAFAALIFLELGILAAILAGPQMLAISALALGPYLKYGRNVAIWAGVGLAGALAGCARDAAQPIVLRDSVRVTPMVSETLVPATEVAAEVPLDELKPVLLAIARRGNKPEVTYRGSGRESSTYLTLRLDTLANQINARCGTDTIVVRQVSEAYERRSVPVALPAAPNNGVDKFLLFCLIGSLVAVLGLLFALLRRNKN